MWKIFTNKADFLKSGNTNTLYNLTAINREDENYVTFEWTKCFSPETTITEAAFQAPETGLSHAFYDMYVEGHFIINQIWLPSGPK